MSNLRKTIQLPDGRKLGYAEWGNPQGFPVIGLHGTPGSRLWFVDDDEISKELGIRLITVDRPGYGISDPKKNRRIPDFNLDLFELVNQLKLDQVSIFGVSGGGPFALAAGTSPLLRLRKVGIVASMSELEKGRPPADMCRPNRLAITLASYIPWLLRFNFRQQKKLMENSPDFYVKSSRKNVGHLCTSDQEVLQSDEMANALLIQMKEALAQGGSEPVSELKLLASRWDFKLEDIRVPVDIWHGDADTLSPISGVRSMISKIPDKEVHFLAGKGHFLDEDEKIWKEILLKLKD